MNFVMNFQGMFQLLFDVPYSGCQSKDFYQLIIVTTYVLIGVKLLEWVKRAYVYIYQSRLDCNICLLICHGSMLIYGIGLILSYPMFDKSFTWKSWPCQVQPGVLEVYYWLQTSFYSYLLVM